MRAAIWEQPSELRIGERPDPTPGEGELVLKVGAWGVCGTDLLVGAGTMGLILLQLVLRSGAARAAVLDTNAAKLPRAQRLGATHVASDLHSFRPALELVAGGAIDVEEILTHDFALEAFGDALDTVRRGEGVKVQDLPGR